ncbi:membrane protein insertion efficiency factor YidD [Tumidithrix elongata RA019]|uniref:Membrane protein insertion efficiency factor YidD n=1 Tax=Tumidithrix elongata BACA0141 TaxID=2716417 RepID=A0AAW9Q4W4_9CYAN|nr:membrane protein insertion efficiency factor YidD [Tumidithrix elongata RA019]
MHTNLLDTTARKIAVTSIAGYQRYISPHKGFSCAHRILHGGESCSQFVKRVIIEEGVMTAVKASRQRFQACKEANQILKARRMGICKKASIQTAGLASTLPSTQSSTRSYHLANISPEPSDPPAEIPEEIPEVPLEGTEAVKAAKKANSSNGCNECGDLGDCSYIGCDVLDDCGSGALNNCSGADCSGCGDCSALDCSGADCSGCGDCGDCGSCSW